MKLVRIFENDVQTRSQYLKQINKPEDEESLPKVPNMNQSEVSKIFEQDSEERAALLFETFQRLTSVVFDLQSLTQLLHREDLSLSTHSTLAHLLFNSLLHLSQMKNLVSKDAAAPSVNLVYLKYWELGTGYLKLSVINELV